MEKDFETALSKSYKTIEKMSMVSTLIDIRNKVEYLNLGINPIGNEYDYCESKGVKRTCEDVIRIINEKILELSKS